MQQAFLAEFLLLGIRSFGNSIRENHQQITGLRHGFTLTVSGACLYSEDQSALPQAPHIESCTIVSANQQRRQMACIYITKDCLLPIVVGPEETGKALVP